MALTFNLLLTDAGIDPAKTRLLRHETRRHGRTPFALWRDDRATFDIYQSFQLCQRRAWFAGRHWASFVVGVDGRTLFAGLYAVELPGPPMAGARDPLNDGLLDPDEVEVYPTSLIEPLRDLIGRLVVDWGSGTRTWVQLAAKQDKPVLELRERFTDPAFPGYVQFMAALSELEALPREWRTALRVAQGIYLLTCPRTREQYVGSATGDGGFIGRWSAYVNGGDGGNVALKSREPSDYRVSILQVAGSADDRETMLAMEASWKTKLQSREMGLNRN